MAVALEIGIGYLLLEFLAHAFVVLRTLNTAGAVSARALQAFLNGGNYFFVGV